MDFSQVTDITIPEGSVIRIAQGETVLWEKSGWPSGYVKVEYLESTGTQYIDTGVVMTDKTDYELDFQFTNATANNNIGSIRRMSNTSYHRDHLSYLISESPNGIYSGCGRNNALLTSSGVLDRHVYRTDKANLLLYLDGVSYSPADMQVPSYNNDPTFWLFARNSNVGTLKTYAITRHYESKFYNNGTLIADLQPCVRLSDGKPGMYDLVRRQFLTNAGTGEFLIGPTVQIPDAYQPVQYLESTGTQYIDTGIEGKNGLDISARFMSADILQTRIMASSDGTKRLGLLASSTTGAIVNQYGTVNKVLSDYVLDTTTIHSLSNKNGVLFYDGAQVDTATTATFTTGKNLYLFASNSTTVATAYVKIYGAMILDNGALVRYFVPCYRKSDDKPGMYDVANNVFYTNDGGGEFAVGPDV